MCATSYAFAALKANGTVVTWGDKTEGRDCSKVQAQLIDVQHISSTSEAFAALKADGTVVAWGGPYQGGRCPDGLADV